MTNLVSSERERERETLMKRSLPEEREIDIVCHEKWSLEKLDQIRGLILPDELRNRLNDIHIEKDSERVKVRYSTCKGDVDGRVYGSIVYYSEWYKKQVAKRGETYVYMNDHPREEEQDGGASLQRMDRWIRRLLAHEFYRDYDIVNCAPSLLEQIIVRAGLTPPPELVAYNTDRETIFSRYKGHIDLGEVKKAFLKVLHMGGDDQRIKETVSLKRSLRATLLLLSQKDERHRLLYERCREACERDSKKKKFSYLVGKEEAKVTTSLGKFCAAVWQREEHTILLNMRAFFISLGYPAPRMVMAFDGIMVEKKNDEVPIDFDALSLYIHQKTGFRVKVEEKSLRPTENDIAIFEGRILFEKK